MDDNCLITINGTMEQHGERDSIELMTRGSFIMKNNAFFISYKETEATGYKDCLTTVRVDDGGARVSMLRFGSAPSQLIIEKGKRHVCHYETGHGDLSLGVSEDEIDSHLSAEGGALRFSYMLDSDTTSISRNEVNITVKPTN